MNTSPILALISRSFTAAPVQDGVCLTCTMVEGHRIAEELGRAMVALRAAGYHTVRAGSCMLVSEKQVAPPAPWDERFEGFAVDACECGAEHPLDCQCDDADPVSGERTGQRGRSESAVTFESEARKGTACRAEIGW